MAEQAQPRARTGSSSRAAGASRRPSTSSLVVLGALLAVLGATARQPGPARRGEVAATSRPGSRTSRRGVPAGTAVRRRRVVLRRPCCVAAGAAASCWLAVDRRGRRAVARSSSARLARPRPGLVRRLTTHAPDRPGRATTAVLLVLRPVAACSPTVGCTSLIVALQCVAAWVIGTPVRPTSSVPSASAWPRRAPCSSSSARRQGTRTSARSGESLRDLGVPVDGPRVRRPAALGRPGAARHQRRPRPAAGQGLRTRRDGRAPGRAVVADARLPRPVGARRHPDPAGRARGTGDDPRRACRCRRHAGRRRGGQPGRRRARARRAAGAARATRDLDDALLGRPGPRSPACTPPGSPTATSRSTTSDRHRRRCSPASRTAPIAASAARRAQEVATLLTALCGPDRRRSERSPPPLAALGNDDVAAAQPFLQQAALPRSLHGTVGLEGRSLAASATRSPTRPGSNRCRRRRSPGSPGATWSPSPLILVAAYALFTTFAQLDWATVSRRVGERRLALGRVGFVIAQLHCVGRRGVDDVDGPGPAAVAAADDAAVRHQVRRARDLGHGRQDGHEHRRSWPSTASPPPSP